MPSTELAAAQPQGGPVGEPVGEPAGRDRIGLRHPRDRFGEAAPIRRPIPVTPHGRETRRRIRREGARLFAAFGVGAVGMNRVAEAVAMSYPGVLAHYSGRSDLLADVLDYHLSGLFERVSAGFDAVGAGPARVESAVGAWLDHLAAEPNEHRAFLISIHLIPIEWRAGLLNRFDVTLETVLEAVSQAIPGLPANAASMRKTAHALLCDPSAWPSPPEAEERRRDARRITGLLLAAARAEISGLWPALGPTDGPPLGAPLVMESRQARLRLKELLDAVATGRQVIIQRRGKPEARLIPAG